MIVLEALAYGILFVFALTGLTCWVVFSGQLLTKERNAAPWARYPLGAFPFVAVSLVFAWLLVR